MRNMDNWTNKENKECISGTILSLSHEGRWTHFGSLWFGVKAASHHPGVDWSAGLEACVLLVVGFHLHVLGILGKDASCGGFCLGAYNFDVSCRWIGGDNNIEGCSWIQARFGVPLHGKSFSFILLARPPSMNGIYHRSRDDSFLELRTN